MLNGKKILFSGMQATGNLTLGNYLGALKNWVTISDGWVEVEGKRYKGMLYIGDRPTLNNGCLLYTSRCV